MVRRGKRQRSSDQVTIQAVEQLEEPHLNLSVVRWVTGEEKPPPGKRQWLDSLRVQRGEVFYSDLLFVLLGRRYSGSDARDIWDALVLHRDVLTEALGRNPGIVVAALDWLTNVVDDQASEFTLIESGRLRNLRESAVVDGLTDLYDHDTFLTLLEKEIERGKRYAEAVALLMLDLDDFKQVNDEFGHQKGDQVLVKLADVIRTTIRAMDIAGRYGGEEFAVILPETDAAAAAESAERLRRAVESAYRQEVQVTASIGVACYPTDGDDVDALVQSADDALYQAKAAGKNRVIAKAEASPDRRRED